MPRQSQSIQVAKIVERIGVIGDVHTERALLATALDHLSQLKPDLLLCTGDLPDGPHEASEVDACCKLLAGANVVTVSGNHDRWLQDGEQRELDGATHLDELAPETVAFLAALPPTVELQTPAGRVLLCHGLGSDDMSGVRSYDHGHELDSNEALQQLLRAGKYRYVINGHTHAPMIRRVGELTVINGGTLLSTQRPCCALLDFAQRRAQFFSLGSDLQVTPGEEHAL
jgi:predicted phosphodiesterase